MHTTLLQEELRAFYGDEINSRAKAFCERLEPMLDGACTPEMNGFARKALQYRTIAREAEPVLFRHSPFYHELGTMSNECDGAGDFRGHSHAGGWNWRRFSHMFTDQDPGLAELRGRQGSERLYLICGPYCDTRQHFVFYYKPVFDGGLRSLYEKAQTQLAGAAPGREHDMLASACEGLLALKLLSEKFSAAAEARIPDAADADEAARLARIRDAAAYTPWNAPRTFYEALNTYAFIRTAVGALEGVGFNSFGRPDVDLLPFYEADLAAGRLTEGEAFGLIEDFLLTWDCHYDHDKPMVGYADHELENTYTLGGCDENGDPVWNSLTEMFLRATRDHKIIFPKIKARYSAVSPKAYLDACNEDVIRSTSSILYQNDDACIPSLVRDGFSLADARDYIVTGCWGLMTNGNLMDDHGNYVNLLKAFEFSVHDRKDKEALVGIPFIAADEARSFEDLYRLTLENCRMLFRERNRMTHLGKPIWPEVDPLPLTSSSMTGCLESRRDLTDGGCKYHHEQYTCVGFPNIIDSLLAMKTLIWDRGEVTLGEYLKAVRANWEGYEPLRQKALKCAFWGDGGEESGRLAARFNHDLRESLGELKTLWGGGRVRLGHLTYTEIRFWAEQTLATPDGRRSGEYFSQGLTPSRLHRIDSVTDVIRSLAALDRSEMGSNNVVNIILPSTRMTLGVCEAFLRAAADSALQCLQLNCVTREQLLDAQKHPENHKNLIIRVCGFSARFTSLSPEWQKEILSRNFYN